MVRLKHQLQTRLSFIFHAAVCDEWISILISDSDWIPSLRPCGRPGTRCWKVHGSCESPITSLEISSFFWHLFSRNNSVVPESRQLHRTKVRAFCGSRTVICTVCSRDNAPWAQPLFSSQAQPHYALPSQPRSLLHSPNHLKGHISICIEENTFCSLPPSPDAKLSLNANFASTRTIQEAPHLHIAVSVYFIVGYCNDSCLSGFGCVWSYVISAFSLCLPLRGGYSSFSFFYCVRSKVFTGMGEKFASWGRRCSNPYCTR